MKRLFYFALTLILLLPMLSAFSVTSEAAMPSPDVLGGYKNVCLTYTYRPNRDDYGRQEVKDLIPYVAYLDTDGVMQDFFFDTYLFLPCNTYGPSGASIHGGNNNPTKAIDWVDYVEDTFADGYNVDALEVAFGKAKETLGDSQRKAGVFFSILYPSYKSKNFGSLGGKELDLSKKEDREYAIKWIIDEQIRLYTEAGYENLDLLGFYWLEEEIYSKYDHDMLSYASNYLHSLGLKFIWIPWYQAPGYNNWRVYGFDLACLQPNDMWPETSDVERVKSCANLCKGYGMSMQIEASHDCALPDRYARYMRYLEGGMSSGAMNSVKFYYQDGKTAVYYAACYSKKKAFRSIYDLTYKYAMGTLTKADLETDIEEMPMELPENVDWVSNGKSYTGCEAFVNGNGKPYQEVSGKELTDGILGSTKDGTEWHAFYKGYTDADGRISTTIDLGEAYTELNHITAQFLSNPELDAGAPADVKIYVSEDGEKFDLLNTMKLKRDGDKYYVQYKKASGFTARYVKMSFLSANSKFVFCSELMVGKDITEDDNSDNSLPANQSDGAEDNSSQGEGGEKENKTLIWVLVGVALIAAATVAAVILYKKKKA